MGSEGVEDKRLNTAQNGCLKTWSESRGKHGIALDGEDWYDVRHGRLIITSDGTDKEYCDWVQTPLCGHTSRWSHL